MPELDANPAPVGGPIILCAGEDCTFYRGPDAVMATVIPFGAKLFDSAGQRLIRTSDGLITTADGANELADLLRDWLGYMDAIRESTANWSLALLVQASVEHLGYTA